ncbi:VOC family protein [Streptomyces sp. NPDC056773]|uniref:VOC family protein n=1 Tax=unclassified Streptomyces TaxID=2593676 RepID=UPI00367D8390
MFANPVHHITFDAQEPYALAQFWSEVTGWPIHPDDLADDPEISLVPGQPGVTGLLFVQVPEGKSAKNRVHLDIQPTTGTRDENVERLIALGAKIQGDHRREDGTGWVTLTDPEGNELCIERSVSERAGA